MSWNPFKKIFSQKPKKYLGIDVGTSFIRLVEISELNNKKKLENYGTTSITFFDKKQLSFSEKSNSIGSVQDITKAINNIIKEAKIEAREVVFSIPDFTTFFINFKLPLIKKSELEKVIQYEARKYIPLPPEKVFLDWQVIKGTPLKEREISISKGKKLEILLVVIPNEVIEQYKNIALACQLELIALEAEVFSLKRALIKEGQKEAIALIDIGLRSTTCSIIENEKLQNSYSFEMSGEEFIKKITEEFNISTIEAEELIKKYGLLNNEEKAEKVYKTLLPLINIVLMEIEKTFYNFYQKGGQDIQKVILAGGISLLPGLKEYFENKLKKEIIFAKPFSDLSYPLVLEKKLKDIGPNYAIAVGAALYALYDLK